MRTRSATVNAIIHAGATPVLADVDPETMNLDPADVARRLTPRTRALVPVHFAGRPCAMDALCALAQKHGLKSIEDCAPARGKGMISAADSSVLLDVLCNDPVHGEASAALLARGMAEGRLIVCECVVAELRPALDEKALRVVSR